MIRSSIAPKMGVNVDDIQNIKNIIFDLGGVLFNIDYQATIRAFQDLQFKDFDKIFTQMKQTSLFDLLETGKIPPQTFRNELRKFKTQLNDEQIDHAWNAMIGDLPTANVELLRRERPTYRIFLLSNTNAIHISYVVNYLNDKFGQNPFPELFEHTYYSHEIGLRKPHPDAFNFVVERAGLNPKETLFIDDLAVNVEGAREAGLMAYHLDHELITNIFD